jgi:hypothetical protein
VSIALPRRDTSGAPYAEIGLSTRLQVLIFSKTDFDTAGLEDLIVTQELRNLKELRFHGIGDSAADSLWASYDFSWLSRALVACTPKLHVFEWSEYRFDPNSRHSYPFSTVVGLNDLTDLTLDYALLPSRRIPDEIIEDGLPAESLAFLPPGHRIIHVTSLTIEILEFMLELEGDGVLEPMLGVSPTLPLETIDLSVIMEREHQGLGCVTTELRSKHRHSISKAVKTIADKGTTLRIWRQDASSNPVASTSTNQATRPRCLTDLTCMRYIGRPWIEESGHQP